MAYYHQPTFEYALLSKELWLFYLIISKEQTHLVAFAFVDDTDLPSLDMRDMNLRFDEVAVKMQEAIEYHFNSSISNNGN